MKEELVFFERQRFNQWWAIGLFAILNGVFVFGCFYQLIAGNQFGNNPLPDTSLMLVTGVVLLSTAFFFSIRLETVINTEGVYFRMFPFHLRFKLLAWETITEAEVRKINPMGELGGWGLRYKFGGSGIRVGINTISYTISGNKVLKLTRINKKTVYIGTRRAEEMSDFLVRLNAERKQK